MGAAAPAATAAARCRRRAVDAQANAATATVWEAIVDQAPPPRRGKSREIVAVYCRVERRRQTYEPAGLARRHKDNDLAVVVGTEFEELHHVPPLGASRAR